MVYRAVFLLALCVWFAGDSGVWADIIVCRDGVRYEGEIVRESSATVRIRTAAGGVTLARVEIRTIERGESVFSVARERRAQLVPEDAEGRWKLVEFCEKGGDREDAAALLQELRELGPPHYAKASQRLAELWAQADPRGALRILSEWSEKTGEDGARRKAAQFKSALAARRQQALGRAEQFLKDKQFSQALEAYREAVGLALEDAAGGGAGAEESRGALLGRVVGLRLEQERSALERLKKEDDLPKVAGSLACDGCGGGTGWAACVRCGGKGTIVEMEPGTLGPKGYTGDRPVTKGCPNCHGAKMMRCKKCEGSGLNMSLIAGRLETVVRGIANQVWTRAVDDPFKALAEMEQKAGFRKLLLPESFTPEYPGATELRKLVPRVPAPEPAEQAEWMAGFLARWQKEPAQVRRIFLVNYAYEVAKHALPLAGHAGGLLERVFPVEAFDWQEIRSDAVEGSAEELSAFPEDWAGKWVVLGAAYAGEDAGQEDRDRIAFRVQSRGPNGLHLFAFLPEARTAHRIGAADYGQAEQFPMLKNLAQHYPYAELAARIKVLHPGDRVRWYGRVLYRKDADPWVQLEVWDLEPQLEPDLQRKVEWLNARVTCNFEQTPLGEALYVLTLLSNTRIRILAPGAGERPVTARILRKSLASALTEILKELRLEWAFDEAGQGLKVVPALPPAESAARAAALRYVRP